MTERKLPPPGVETTPGGPVVSLAEAAPRLNKDPRTLIARITRGELRGGAEPRPKRLRWYVYADELPTPPATSDSASTTAVDELRAQLMSQIEANRLLIAAQQDLLEVDATVADKYRGVARRYLDALSQFMTPGHLGELTVDR